MAVLLSRRVSAAFVVLVLAGSLLSGLGAPAAAGEEPTVGAAARTTHKSPSMIDVSSPVYEGYSKKLKAYKFTVYGRWNPKCSGNYCWPAPCGSSCSKQDIGSNDAARFRFSDSVAFKRMAISNYGACGDRYYNEAKNFSSGSFEEAYAGVNDEVVTSWVYTFFDGETVINKGWCKKDSLPVTSGGAGGAGGSGGYQHFGDLKGRTFKYSVWVNPLPSRGKCYDRLYVNAGYTHTWTDQSLTWSLGYPWGIGVGTQTSDGSFTAWQNTDGDPDPSLRTPRMCRH